MNCWICLGRSVLPTPTLAQDDGLSATTAWYGHAAGTQARISGFPIDLSSGVVLVYEPAFHRSAWWLGGSNLRRSAGNRAIRRRSRGSTHLGTKPHWIPRSCARLSRARSPRDRGGSPDATRFGNGSARFERALSRAHKSAWCGVAPAGVRAQVVFFGRLLRFARPFLDRVGEADGVFRPRATYWSPPLALTPDTGCDRDNGRHIHRVSAIVVLERPGTDSSAIREAGEAGPAKR